MSDNKQYYYLRVKDNFYDSEEMIILQNMQDGYLYSDILMKLYLRSIKNDGKLMFKDRIPYNSTILAQVVRHNVGVVEKALQLFKDLGLIEVLDNGAIYMIDIQNYIGHSTTEADRKRKYRNKIETEKVKLLNGQMSDKCPDKYPPEIEIELELELELEKEKKINIYNDVVESYNSTCVDLPQVKKLTVLRKKRIDKVLKVITMDELRLIFTKVHQSDFLSGRSGEWRSSFDWIFENDKNYIKILEGNYDNKVQKPKYENIIC